MRHKGLFLLGLIAALCALLLFMPLRFALNMVLPSSSTLTARAASGTIWSGQIAGIKMGQISLGDMQAGLAILPLFTAHAEYHFEPMANGTAQPLQGRVGTGFGGRYVADLNGQLPLEGVDARLPLSHLELTGFSAAFDGGVCRRASGSVRMLLKPGSLDALGLNNGFLGQAKCDKNALLLPLVSQSSNERAEIRLQASGDYVVTVTIQNENPEVGLALTAAGFAPIAQGYRMSVKGQL
ncbi:type II secretion system protein N [Sphingorhabdus arenilitoris]|uniref:Type II secretion system protein N n=1 Tax=Sphingorhabdus arenilitoris TaxID=1490041 RepID=A0ABV8RIU7_9SPHN